VANSVTCNNLAYVCDTINGHNYWHVNDQDCNTKCIAESDLQFALDAGYSCGPCRSCSLTEHQCDTHKDELKFMVMRHKDNGKCEQKCEKQDNLEKKFEDGFTCGSCPPKDIDTTQMGTPGEPFAEKCTFKRAAHYMKFEPNWPAKLRTADPDLIIQIKSHRTGNIFNYTIADVVLDDEDEGIIHLNDNDYNDMWSYDIEKDLQLTSVQFISTNGPGGWNSCNYSPIAIDLNNDGIIERITRDEGWEIDITGDGELEFLNEWFGPEEGILLDLTGKFFGKDIKHGVTGAQLLGDMGHTYSDGFEKLAKHDLDGNGIVDGPELKGFWIWRDVNSNARVDLGEISTVAENKIIGLRLAHDNNLKSTAIMADKSELMVQDLWLQR